MITTIYNIDELEEYLKPKGITRTSIYRAIALGKLRAIRIGKRYIVSENSLNLYLEGNANEM